MTSFRDRSAICPARRAQRVVPALLLGALSLAIVAPACSKESKPPATESKPASPATEPSTTNDNAMNQATDDSRGSGPATPTGAAGAAFTASEEEFAAFVSQFPAIALPQSLPLADDKIQAMKKRAVQERHRDAYLCGTGFFDCKLAEQRSEFFHGYRFDISRQAVGLLYHGIGDMEVQLVLMTYDTRGKPVAGLIVAGEFGDLEWGFDGAIKGDRTIERNRYVWIGGEEKEYVKDRSYRITETGAIEETI